MVTIDDLLDNDDEKKHAIYFLKKVFNSENNLKISEIRKSFDLDFVKKHIEDININDIIHENIEKNKNTEKDIVFNSNNYIIENNVLYKHILEIIPKNEIGIKTTEIINYIILEHNLNISKRDMHDKIYNKLLSLEKKETIKSYKNKNKLFWIKL
jgi:hypothetical protein